MLALEHQIGGHQTDRGDAQNRVFRSNRDETLHGRVQPREGVAEKARSCQEMR